ncbi:hypothetical protein DFH09DRAFT_1278100 [Mycena vulgaris]|nr:hypothetical protein DFH09DRAFT_1278100 [Mycena vulgaris]
MPLSDSLRSLFLGCVYTHSRTRITQAALLFFKNISAEPSDDNPETVDIYTILRGAVGGSPKCKAVTMAHADPLASSSTNLQRNGQRRATPTPRGESCLNRWMRNEQNKQSQRAKMTHEGHGVTILLRENLWTEDRQLVYFCERVLLASSTSMKSNPGVDLDNILWRINSWWIRDYSGLPVIIRNPQFYTKRSVWKESWLKSTAEWSVGPQPLHQVVSLNDQFIMYIDKLSCLWFADTKQRFGNICRLGEPGSYLVKASSDAYGILHNSSGLGRPFEDRELHVVRQEGRRDKPPVRNTWKQLLDEWDATDSKIKFIVTLPQAPDSRVPPPAGTSQGFIGNNTLHSRPVAMGLPPYPTPPATPQPPTTFSASGSGAGEVPMTFLPTPPESPPLPVQPPLPAQSPAGQAPVSAASHKPSTLTHPPPVSEPADLPASAPLKQPSESTTGLASPQTPARSPTANMSSRTTHAAHLPSGPATTSAVPGPPVPMATGLPSPSSFPLTPPETPAPIPAEKKSWFRRVLKYVGL